MRKPASEKASAKELERSGNYLKISNYQQLDYVSNEAMNTLCTNLSYCGKEVHKIMVTSRYSGEGKTYISMNLLRTFSQLGKRTVLIDTDLRASGIQSSYRLRYSTKNHYDVVLIDTPPVGILADAVALAKFCDGTLLVVGLP